MKPVIVAHLKMTNIGLDGMKYITENRLPLPGSSGSGL